MKIILVLSLIFSLSQADWGTNVLINLHDCNPELIRNESHINSFVDVLTSLIDKKKASSPIVAFLSPNTDVVGYCAMNYNVTSYIIGHFIDETNSAHIDVFCRREFSIPGTVEFSRVFFGAKKVDYKVVNRK